MATSNIPRPGKSSVFWAYIKSKFFYLLERLVLNRYDTGLRPPQGVVAKPFGMSPEQVTSPKSCGVRYAMVQRFCNQAAVWVLGVFVGVVLTAAGLGVGQGVRVEATATHGVDNFAIATGFVDQKVEALYFLDFLTGELRAVTISRHTGQFDSLYQYNVQRDFGEEIKNPRYLLVTGRGLLPRGSRNTQLAASLVYVAEATTGQVYAYAMPWDSSANAARQPQSGQFIPMGGGSMRSTFIRDAED